VAYLHVERIEINDLGHRNISIYDYTPTFFHKISIEAIGYCRFP
jgi:hypothetical protein